MEQVERWDPQIGVDLEGIAAAHWHCLDGRGKYLPQGK
jgi:hypothetical protein